MLKKIRKTINSWKLKKQEKSELVSMIEDLDQKLKIQLNKAIAKIEELSQEKLYFIYVEADDTEIIHIKEQFSIIKKMMKWSAPNIIIFNRPLIELSKEKLKELDNIRKKLTEVKKT